MVAGPTYIFAPVPKRRDKVTQQLHTAPRKHTKDTRHSRALVPALALAHLHTDTSLRSMENRSVPAEERPRASHFTTESLSFVTRTVRIIGTHLTQTISPH